MCLAALLKEHIITLLGIEPVTLPPEKEETRYHQEVQEEKIAKYVVVYISFIDL